MQRLVLVFACLLCAASAEAEIRRFPYEAIVKTDDVPVRSGPGKKFYETTRLKKNATVVVHRHDLGGWYMIGPPEGSFSWIRADLVQVEAAGSGVVNLTSEGATGAPVWVGSEVTDEHATRGRILAHGDAVQILSEDQWTTTTGTVSMLRIAPPASEFRWVKGDFVVPRDPALRQATQADPYSNPLAATDPAAIEEQSSEPLPALSREPRQTTSVEPLLVVTDTASLPSATSTDARAALREIDSNYTAMIERDPAEWDIDELIRSYKGLADSAPHLAKSIEQRVTALESRRQLSEEYRSFIQLTSETNARDQELAAQGQIAVAEMTSEVQLGEPSPIEHDAGAIASTTDFGVNHSFADGTLPMPTPLLSTASTTPPTASEAPLVGAGIVRKLTVQGQPVRYGLVSPQGKVLAILQVSRPADLERVLGQAMGFTGERKFDPQLGTDLLQVTQMVPVQLQTK